MAQKKLKVLFAPFFLIGKKFIVTHGMLDEDIAHTSISIEDAGIDALRDEVLEDEITTYNNDWFYQYFRWVLPIVAIVISLLSVIISFTCSKNEQPRNILQISTQPRPIDTQINKARTSKKALYPNGKGDSSQPNSGQ